MSGRVQWKKFAFFDKDTVNENLAGTLDAQLTCACADNGLLLFGDSSGFISLSDRNLHLSWKHKAFRGPVKGVAYVESQRRQYVIAAGDEYSPPEVSGNALGPVSSTDAGVPPRSSDMSDGSVLSASSPSRFAVKIFQANDMSRPLQAFLVTQSCVQGHVLTAFSVNSDCTLISVGFSNGALMLYGGHFLQDHALGRAPPAPIVLFPSHQAAISALHFCELYMLPAARSGGSVLRQIRLFAVLDTEATNRSSQVSDPGGASGMGGIFVFDTSMADRETVLSGSAIPQPVTLPRLGVPRMLDERGASAQCSSIMVDTAELVIGREEGVFLYSVDDRGGAAGFEGEKQCVSAVGRYILVGSMDTKTRRVLVTIYDLRNKFISMSHLLAPGDNIKMVLHDGGVAYVVTTAGTLIRFREKDTLCKVDVLLKKSLHALAISLAAEEQAPVAEVMKLYKQYGDHLFRRGDHEAAVQQYCHTIGFVPASYVIRRFLDSQRIGHLTSYLETLHSKGFASKDLTTLLLTCYTKTRDVDRLDAFISQGEHDLSSNHQVDSPSKKYDSEEDTLLGGMDAASRKFDIASAIATLRHAGYTAHAMKLALKYGDHVGYLSMLLYPNESDHIDTGAQDSRETTGGQAGKEGEAVLDAGTAAFGHIVGIVEEVVYCVKKDLDNGFKYTTTASSQAAHYMTRKMSSGTSMRITESTNAKLDALLALLKKHGRRVLHLKPDAMTGLLIMLYTGVPLGVVKETRDVAADDADADNVTTSSIDVKELLYAVTSQAAMASTGTPCEGSSTIHVSNYSDPLYCVEDLVPVFIDDCDVTGSGGTQQVQGWHQRYLTAFLEGTVLALSGGPAGSPPANSSGQSDDNVGSGVVINMKGGRRHKLSSHMTGLLLELYLDQYDKLKRSSVASSTAKVNGIPLLSEHQRKVAITQLEAKIMNMLDGTVAADYDTGHALLLVHSFGFLPGMLYLLEKSQSVDVILGQLREKKDYSGIFRILRREGSKNPDLMLQQLEYFVLDSVEMQQQRVGKHQKDKGGAAKKGGNTPQAVLQQAEDSDDEYQSSHGMSSAASESGSEESDSDGDIFDNVETMLDILEPEVMYAGSVSAGEHHHGHVCISQVLKILALNPALPLHIPLELIKNSLRGASNGLQKLEKDTYKMRLSIDALLNKAETQKMGHKSSTGPKDKSASNPFGNSDSEDEGYGSSRKTGMMVGYSEGDDNGDEDYEHMVQQAELAREKQHWDGIKKAQMEKINDHEGFYAELDASPDGFATVASFFCKKPIIS